MALRIHTLPRRLLALALVLLAWSLPAAGGPFKVLVVMSYEQDNPWCEGIRQGIDSVLAPVAEISYFYLNTKADFQGGPARAEGAAALYRELQPDGVIAADDDAQSMFVVPFLKDKVRTPVMFCGVNAEAAAYGFPNSHISGVLERGHVAGTLALVQQLLPKVRKACFVVGDSPAGRALEAQVAGEKSDYPARVGGFFKARTVADLRQFSRPLASCDALYIDSLEGIADDAGRRLVNREVFDVLFGLYKGPILGANPYHVEEGALCAVVKTGQEQGSLAAQQLLKAMQGTPVSQVPVTRNFRGRLMINIDTLDRMGIRPKPIVLQGADLVKTR